MASRTTSKSAQPAASGQEWIIPPECVPDVTPLVIEDGKPLDNTLHERNMHLLVELQACWAGPGENRPFIVWANVGLFYAYHEPPVVPDVMLTLDVTWPSPLNKKEHLSYFVWVVGKHPDVVVEIVSKNEGGEDSYKKQQYAKIGIPYYVIFDPANKLGKGVLRSFELAAGRYRPLPSNYFEGAGLGVKLWDGVYAAVHDTYLRWCDKDGKLIPTAIEKATEAEKEVNKAKKEATKSKKVANEAKKEANEAKKEASDAKKEASQAIEENERLRKLLRSRGIEPPA